MSTKKSRPSAPSAPSTPQDVVEREFSNAVVFFHETVASHLGMSAADWKCLGLLDQHGPSTPGRLAELSGFTTGAITGIVDRLERAGYARRERHPSDRRSVIVHPLQLKELKERVAPIFQSLRRSMVALASRYSESELAAVGSYLKGVTEVLRQETAKLKHVKERSSGSLGGGKSVAVASR